MRAQCRSRAPLPHGAGRARRLGRRENGRAARHRGRGAAGVRPAAAGRRGGVGVRIRDADMEPRKRPRRLALRRAGAGAHGAGARLCARAVCAPDAAGRVAPVGGGGMGRGAPRARPGDRLARKQPRRVRAHAQCLGRPLSRHPRQRRRGWAEPLHGLSRRRHGRRRAPRRASARPRRRQDARARRRPRRVQYARRRHHRRAGLPKALCGHQSLRL